MAGIPAPSFSLGIDFDANAAPDQADLSSARPSSNPSCSGVHIREDDDEEWLNWREEETPLLKRLRRGPAGSSHRACGGVTGVEALERNDLDDDIEDFSPQEGSGLRGEHSSQQYHSICGSSKLSLHGRRVLMTHSASKVNASNNKTCPNDSLSNVLEASGTKNIFPKLTISPLRRIQFLDDSDSEDSLCTRPKTDCGQRKQGNSTNDKTKNKFTDGIPSESFWKDFDAKSTVKFATPALDDFCNEYINSGLNINPRLAKENPSNFTGFSCRDNICQRSYILNELGKESGNTQYQWNWADPQPPAYQYFLHYDMNIRMLVQERLHTFIPLGATVQGQNRNSDPEIFDYTEQFSSPNARAKPSALDVKNQTRKSGKRKRSQSAVVDNGPSPSENWVCPRSSTTYPKDAGKRRVHVENRASGHWYTQGGRKVYISKGGEELSGQAAYKCYRRESGAGFRKTKKKSAIKKKTKK